MLNAANDPHTFSFIELERLKRMLIDVAQYIRGERS